ncbi:hypothetical protein BWP39_13120 [Paraburkholderia acidicola]|uniref:Uncharacterized protein n=1 Tax=Paraburkholderia acidicola TaxID=1912599 RepID=A0A2A4EV24_9BURK|nr:hypothetical protein BWP39_13120 [Paraburkholderia acidicola]
MIVLLSASTGFGNGTVMATVSGAMTTYERKTDRQTGVKRRTQVLRAAHGAARLDHDIASKDRGSGA